MKTVAGVFQIDEEKGFVGFKAYGSVEVALESLKTEGEMGVFSIKGYRLFWDNQREFLEKAGIPYDEFQVSRRSVAIGLAEEMLSTSMDDADVTIQSIDALGDLNRTLGLLVSRLAAMCSAFGAEVDLVEGEMDHRGVLEASQGISSQLVAGLAHQIEEIVTYKDSLETYVESLMQGVAPNIAGLIGPLLGAKFISKARGLENLARMPGSRVQVLGAERAVFRHLRGRGKPPKHGLIFQHPTISKSPWWQRGKIARSLASKLAIAARIDAYSGEDRSEELKEGFMKRYEMIKKVYAEEPKKLRIIKTPRTGKKRRRR